MGKRKNQMQVDLKKQHDLLKNQATWSLIEARREEVSKIEAEKRARERINAGLKSVPTRFLNKTFADFHIDYPAQAKIKTIAESYAETFHDRLLEGMCLIFLGSTGTGKTLLALILYQYLIKQGLKVNYQPSINFLRLLQDKQFESYHALENDLNYYKELPFLIIDEVTEGCGKGAYPADWERHLLRMLIDVRYQANRCTLVISNRSKKDFIERIGEPCFDRLSENSAIFAFNWPSYRQK
jgi:DNA replication protein DnaC